MFHGKPIIGITGGIGSGKSTVAAMFGEIGCLVISADQQVQQVYQDPAVIEQMRKWWGNEVLQADGQLNKGKIADIIFADPEQRKKLEGLLHPRVAQLRDRRMAEAGDDPQVKAIVWDTPLLFEAGLRGGCDAVVFVEVPPSQRLERLAGTGAGTRRNFAAGKNRNGPWTRSGKYPIILLITPPMRIMSAAKSEKCFSEFSLNDFRIRPDGRVLISV